MTVRSLPARPGTRANGSDIVDKCSATVLSLPAGWAGTSGSTTAFAGFAALAPFIDLIEPALAELASSSNKRSSPKRRYRISTMFRLICCTACPSYFLKSAAMHTSRGALQSIWSAAALPSVSITSSLNSAWWSISQSR